MAVMRSLAWPDRFLPFFFVSAEKGLVWFTDATRLSTLHCGGGDNNKNVINALIRNRTRLVQTLVLLVE